jgi:hypothetical protein
MILKMKNVKFYLIKIFLVIVNFTSSSSNKETLENLSYQHNQDFFQGNLIRFFPWPLNLLNPTTKDPSSNEIEYEIQYDEVMKTDYLRRPGEEGLIYMKKDVIEKQRSVCSYLIKKIGSNLMKGKSIMNISLPIDIFDARSLLEQWVWQNGLSSEILELDENTPAIEKLKYSTVFALSKFHLQGAPLKPFNPIIGETFQCKLNDSNYYLEQIAHHPPIFRFYAKGKKYKLFGFEEASASTGVNSLTVYYKGNFCIEYSDQTQNVIIYPTLTFNGIIMGDRKSLFNDKLVVFDQRNNLISVVEFEKKTKKKLLGIIKSKVKSTKFPDYFSGGIFKMSDFKIKQINNDLINDINDLDSKKKLCNIEGAFLDEIMFDDKVYYSFDNSVFPKFFRENFVLPSDSCYRKDEILFKMKEKDLCQKYKILLEELQRKDYKLREKYKKK